MDCPVSGFDEVGDRVTEAPTCDAAMQLLMACQMGSSADVAVSLIVIKKCEGDFLSSLSDRARRGYERKVGACGKNFSGEGGTLVSIDQGDLRGAGGARLCDAGR